MLKSVQNLFIAVEMWYSNGKLNIQRLAVGVLQNISVTINSLQRKTSETVDRIFHERIHPLPFCCKEKTTNFKIIRYNLSEKGASLELSVHQIYCFFVIEGLLVSRVRDIIKKIAKGTAQALVKSNSFVK